MVVIVVVVTSSSLSLLLAFVNCVFVAVESCITLNLISLVEVVLHQQNCEKKGPTNKMG